MLDNNTLNNKNNFNKTNNALPILLLMACITLMAILCELVPSGVLPMMAKFFNVTEAEAGILVGSYAIASAISGIPLVSLTSTWNRKRLLFILLIGFAFSNIVVGIAPNFTIAILGRVMGGVCAGTLWPMITAYGMVLVDENHKGRAVTIIMSGITVGMSVGLPFMTYIGTVFDYHSEFLLMGILIFIIAILCSIFLPKVNGESHSKANSIFTMLKNRGVLLVILLTFLAVGLNYGLYTFITNLVTERSYPNVALAQIFFGIGSIISVYLTIRFIDKHMLQIVISLFGVGILAMMVFYFAKQLLMLHIGFLLWGLGFGSLSSIFQAATARQVKEGTAVANSLQSASFNFSIMIGSSVAGALLANGGVSPIILLAMVVFACGVFVTFVGRKRLI